MGRNMGHECVRGHCVLHASRMHTWYPRRGSAVKWKLVFGKRFASYTCSIGVELENKLYASEPLCKVRADVTLGCRGLPFLHFLSWTPYRSLISGGYIFLMKTYSIYNIMLEYVYYPLLCYFIIKGLTSPSTRKSCITYIFNYNVYVLLLWYYCQ